MPSGYTEALCSGKKQTPEQFIWQCVRAMGVTIMMRDDDFKKAIPKAFKEEPYFQRAVDEARAEYTRISSMTFKEIERELKAKHRKAVAELKAANKRRAATKKRVEAMSLAISRVKPPTTEHDGLWDFMAQQLVQCLDFDCDQLPIPKEGATPADAVQVALDRLGRAQHALEEEKLRVRQRNRWLDDLRKVVAQPKKLV